MHTTLQWEVSTRCGCIVYYEVQYTASEAKCISRESIALESEVHCASREAYH